MTVLKEYNPATGTWEPILVGVKGDTGAPGGPVPTGGTLGQLIVKTSSTDFAVAWQHGPTRTLASFGAVGNTTTNDAPAIQAAIDWALVNNGCLTGTPGAVYGIGAVWPVISAAGVIQIDLLQATLKGLAGSTVLFEVVGKSGRQVQLRNFILNGTGRNLAASIGMRVRNCQTLTFDGFKATQCDVVLDEISDGTGPGNDWCEQNDYEHWQCFANHITRRMTSVNGGADSHGGNRYREWTISDTDIGTQILGTATWYGGSETGLVLFLSATGSPIGWSVAGSMVGSIVSGRIETTTANTPTAIQFLSTAKDTNRTEWNLTITNQVTLLSDATTNGRPKLNIVKTGDSWTELTVNGNGGRLGFYGATPTPRVGAKADVTSIYNALVKLGLVEAISPLNMVPFMHALWADDPLWVRPADGAPVDYWRNAANAGNPTGTGATRPTMRYSVATLNNRAAIEFNGAATQWLDVDIENEAQPMKIVIVANSTGGTGIRQLMGRAVGGGGIGLDSSSKLRIHFSTLLTGVTTVSSPAGHILRVEANGATSKGYIDGVLDITGNANTGGVGNLAVGASSDAAIPPAHIQFWTGNIAFLGIYDGATTPDSELQKLENWLGYYYATPGSWTPP